MPLPCMSRRWLGMRSGLICIFPTNSIIWWEKAGSWREQGDSARTLSEQARGKQRAPWGQDSGQSPTEITRTNRVTRKISDDATEVLVSWLPVRFRFLDTVGGGVGTLSASCSSLDWLSALSPLHDHRHMTSKSLPFESSSTSSCFCLVHTIKIGVWVVVHLHPLGWAQACVNSRDADSCARTAYGSQRMWFRILRCFGFAL